MAISAEGVRITHYANGVAVDFTFPFRFVDASDLEVYVDGVLKYLGIDYSVGYLVGEDYVQGGVVTFNWLPGSGAIIVLRRAIPATQPTEYGLLGSYSPAQIEADLDRRAMLEQQLLDMLARCLIYPMSEDPPNRELPAIADRAGEGLIFDVDGNIIAGSFYSGDPASAWGKTLIDDANAAAGRATLGITAAIDPVVTAATLAAALSQLGVSTYIQTLIDDTTASAARSTLGVREGRYLVGDTDYVVTDAELYVSYLFATTLTANRTLTLPTAADNAGRMLVVAKIDSSAYTVIVDGEGSEQIGPALTFSLYSQYDHAVLVCTGSAWIVVSTNGPLLSFTSTSDVTQSSPGAGTVYNLGTQSLTIPAGVWELSFECYAGVTESTSAYSRTVDVGLSTANNSFTDNLLRARASQTVLTATGPTSQILRDTLTRVKRITLAASTTYYLNASSGSAATSLGIYGTVATTAIYARRIG